MIEWMQKHRKYLVITIWISTIAFVGAGFVGWGSYSLGQGNSSVAKVGKRHITYAELNNAYSNTYNRYNQALNGTLTQEKAKELGLENMVISSLIREALFLNYADDLGIVTLDEDITQALAKEEAFRVDGKFNKEQYKNILRNVRMTEKDYEESLRKSILLQKLQDFLKISTNDTLVELIGAIMYPSDVISYEIVNIDTNTIKITDEELKKFWEPIKDQFKTEKTYDVLSKFISTKDIAVDEKKLLDVYEENKFNYLDNEGKIKSFEDAKEQTVKDFKLKIAKKNALKEYLKIKNKESNLTIKETIANNFDEFPTQQLDIANTNDIIKPFEYKNGYKILQLVKINHPQTMKFDEAKDQVVSIYKTKKTNEKLTEMAQNRLKKSNFLNITNITKEMILPINGLNIQETQHFANLVFNTNKMKNYVLLDNKAVVYNIVEQKLLDANKIANNKEKLTNLADGLLNTQLNSDLIKQLEKRYKIEQYYKGQ